MFTPILPFESKQSVNGRSLLPEVADELRLREEDRKRARSERLRERGLITRGRGAKGLGKSRRVRRAAARTKVLPEDRICPQCGQLRLESRKWVVAPNGVVMCLGCWRKHKNTFIDR